MTHTMLVLCDVIAVCTYSECAALPAGDVKVDDIVSRNDVGDAITILGYLGDVRRKQSN